MLGGFMSSVTSEAKRKPSRLFLYAQEKWGKTSFAAFAPAPIFAMTRGEDGLVTLMNAGRLPPTPHFPDEAGTWATLRQYTAALRDEEHDRKTFVVDTANGAARLLAETVCQDEFDGSWTQFTAYGRGWDVCVSEWLRWLADLDRLRENRGMSIVLLAHAEVKGFKNPTGADFDRYQPEMPKQLWSVTHKWGDAILFGSFRINAHVECAGKEKRVKGQGGNARVLNAGENAAFLAGNRYGLANEINCGACAEDAWKNFLGEMKKARPADRPKPEEKKSAEGKPEEKKPPAEAVEMDEHGVPILFPNGAPPTMPTH